MRDHNYYVYIVTNKHRTTLYIGMTNDLGRRMAEHKNGEVQGFTQRYQLNRLLRGVEAAIRREKRLKGWLRSKKIALIEKTNPRWFDLSADWEQEPRIDRGWPTFEEMIRDSSPAARDQNDSLREDCE
ncbi:MAG: GIY-YIG nuclease family protein [Chthoniobacterales bacterium]